MTVPTTTCRFMVESMQRHQTWTGWQVRALLLIRLMSPLPCVNHAGRSCIRDYIRWGMDVHGITRVAVPKLRVCPRHSENWAIGWGWLGRHTFDRLLFFHSRKWRDLIRTAFVIRPLNTISVRPASLWNGKEMSHSVW